MTGMYFPGEKRFESNERRPTSKEWWLATATFGLLGAVGLVYIFSGSELGGLVAETLTSVVYLVTMLKLLSRNARSEPKTSWREESPMPVSTSSREVDTPRA